MITSTSNERIKMIRKLREKKYRAESGLFFLEGIRITIEALNDPASISELIVARELLVNEKARETIREAEEKGIPILEVSGEVFQAISGKDGPQGLAAVGIQRWHTLEESCNPLEGIWIALYQVADPGNLGTILRTLDGMGGRGIFLIDNCTDPYDSSAIRASMGSVFTKKLIKLNSEEFTSWVGKTNQKVVGTADSASADYRNADYAMDMILLMGSEREGLSVELSGCCESIVSIPMMGNADSLNLAVASSIMLYEIATQQNMLDKKE